jgi:hypothetical protein
MYPSILFSSVTERNNRFKLHRIRDEIVKGILWIVLSRNQSLPSLTSQEGDRTS